MNKILLYFVVQLCNCCEYSSQTKPAGQKGKKVEPTTFVSDIRPKIQNVPVHYAATVRAFGVVGFISSYTLL